MTSTAQLGVNISPRQTVCAIIVTYFPDGEFEKRLEAAKSQVAAVVVVDNSADRSSTQRLEKLDDRVHLIFNHANVGLAAALNSGVAWAKAAGYCWALLLDQDTTVHQDTVKQLLSIAYEHPLPDRIAAVGSNYRSDNSSGRNSREETTVITSGTLLSLAAFDRIGPFREEFFVDCVDLEYCLRARTAGFVILQSTDKLIDHQIGKVTKHRLLSFRTGTSNHPVIRRYYIARNLAIIGREYWHREPRWLLRIMFNQFKSLVLVCLFEKNRWRKLKFFLLGLHDGLKRRFGRDLAEPMQNVTVADSKNGRSREQNRA